jgi:hypothetical protein
MDETWILGLIFAGCLTMIYLILTPERRRVENDLKQLQSDADVLETYIRHFLTRWWKDSGNDDPALRWKLKVSMVQGRVCAYVWRHCRPKGTGSQKVIVYSRYWERFHGGPMDRDSRIMDQALLFVEAAFKKEPTPLSGNADDL